MFYGHQIEDTRQFFFNSWQKYKEKLPLEPLETAIVNVILAHPEYHSLLDEPANLNKPYLAEMGETNPFLHMGLHIAIREQLATDRPEGIRKIHQRLLSMGQDALTVEHLMMEQLAECLWRAQKDNRFPDHSFYLQQLEKLIQNR